MELHLESQRLTVWRQDYPAGLQNETMSKGKYTTDAFETLKHRLFSLLSLVIAFSFTSPLDLP